MGLVNEEEKWNWLEECEATYAHLGGMLGYVVVQAMMRAFEMREGDEASLLEERGKAWPRSFLQGTELNGSLHWDCFFHPWRI